MKIFPAASSRAIYKVQPVRRSAGFQPAVSPISNRLSVAVTVAPDVSVRSQAGSPAIQQVGNPRYDLVHRPSSSSRFQRGNMLIVAMVFGAVVAIVLASYLGLVQSRNLV